MVFKIYNPNPRKRRVGDCAVRAFAKATGQSWDDAYDELVLQGKKDGDMPSSDAVWGACLANRGFRRFAVSSRCPDCYTAKMFVQDHPKGIYVLAFGGHVATAINGVLYDSYDSTSLAPQFYWYKRR